MRSPRRRELVRVFVAVFVYVVIAVMVTWPLARGLDRDVPADLSDPLLNIWILSWDAEQIRTVLGGDFSAIARAFDANIFYPAPLTLAYSEHLFAEAAQIFPIYLVTRNPILCYNLLFLATYVLSGLGAYLFVRELTGDWRAAFVGGLLFAFVPYRSDQAGHLQVLSSQWMPFTLYGLTQYLNTRRLRPLVGGAGALVLQNLSCGYYLLYFTPFVAAYLLWEIWRRRMRHDRRLWLELGVTALLVSAVTVPFLVPYAQARASLQMTRGLDEVISFSADTHSYLAARPLWLWGNLFDTYRKAEGQLFPGVAATGLGFLAFAVLLRSLWRARPDVRDRIPLLTACLVALAAVCLALIVTATFERRVAFDLYLFELRVGDIGRALVWFGAIVGCLLAVSPRVRATLRSAKSTEAFFFLAIVAAWWLSLGPQPETLGRPLNIPAPYLWLYGYVPGFDGLRVPARLAMVLALMLSTVGAMVIARVRSHRWRTYSAAALACVFLGDLPGERFTLNRLGDSGGYGLPDARVYPPRRAPLVYRRIAALSPDAVILELPLGVVSWDAQSVYYSTVHWRRILNGYSGFFPAHYSTLTSSLADPTRSDDLAWRVIVAAGVTHIVLHERAYDARESAGLRNWLTQHGARELVRADGHTLYELP